MNYALMHNSCVFHFLLVLTLLVGFLNLCAYLLRKDGFKVSAFYSFFGFFFFFFWILLLSLFFFFFKSFNLHRLFLIIVLYYQIKIPIDFRSRRTLNLDLLFNNHRFFF